MSDSQRLDGIGIAGGLMKRGLRSFQSDIDCISPAIYLIESIYRATLTLNLVMIGHSLAIKIRRLPKGIGQAVYRVGSAIVWELRH